MVCSLTSQTCHLQYTQVDLCYYGVRSFPTISAIRKMSGIEARGSESAVYDGMTSAHPISRCTKRGNTTVLDNAPSHQGPLLGVKCWTSLHTWATWLLTGMQERWQGVGEHTFPTSSQVSLLRWAAHCPLRRKVLSLLYSQLLHSQASMNPLDLLCAC